MLVRDVLWEGWVLVFFTELGDLALYILYRFCMFVVQHSQRSFCLHVKRMLGSGDCWGDWTDRTFSSVETRMHSWKACAAFSYSSAAGMSRPWARYSSAFAPC